MAARLGHVGHSEEDPVRMTIFCKLNNYLVYRTSHIPAARVVSKTRNGVTGNGLTT